MPKTPLETKRQAAIRRTDAIRAGAVRLPLQAGPKWIARLEGERRPSLDTKDPAKVLPGLLALMPKHVNLSNIEVSSEGWFATPNPDAEGKYAGYLTVRCDGVIEWIACLNTSTRMEFEPGWSPDSYESYDAGSFRLPLTQALQQLGILTPTPLFMSLTELSGARMVTASGTSQEVLHSILEGVDSLQFPEVQVGTDLEAADSLRQAFAAVRTMLHDFSLPSRCYQDDELAAYP